MKKRNLFSPVLSDLSKRFCAGASGAKPSDLSKHLCAGASEANLTGMSKHLCAGASGAGSHRRSRRRDPLSWLLAASAALMLVCGSLPSGLTGPGLARVCAAEQEQDQNLWNEDYYRAADASGELSGAEQEELDRICLDFMKEYHADLSLVTLTPDQYEGMTLAEAAEGYYTDAGFGYGSGRDGFQMAWDLSTDEVVVVPFGAAKDLVPESYLAFVSENVVTYKKDYGVFGPLYATTRYLSNYLRGGGDESAAVAGAGQAGGESETPASPDSVNNDAAARSAAPDIAEGSDPTPAQRSETGEAGTGSTAGAPAGEDSEAGSPASPAGGDSGAGSPVDAGENAASVRQSGEGDGLQLLDNRKDDSSQTGTGSSGEDDGSSGSALSDKDRLLPDGTYPDPSLRMGEDAAAAGLPAWYPKDPLSFPFYHDAAASRVVDLADIFSDEEEARMESRLADLRNVLQKDIVIHTTDTTYGLSHSIYAADFYDFNGYGIGDDREGVCLMVSMDPDNRGWWSCCTGPETRGLYTEQIANQIDDLLYEYMIAGKYGAGVEDWIENFRRLYTTGSPYSEDWALADMDSFPRFHDPDAPRVIDDAGLLTPTEKENLEKKASGLSEKYGIDVVIHTALNPGILSRGEFCDRFWFFHGYGTGEGYDGLQLTIFKRPNYIGYSHISATGSGTDKLTDVNLERLTSRCDSLVEEGNYNAAADQWLSQADHMLRTGRAPRSMASWGISTALELLAGLLFGGISLGRAKARMATPKIQENADAYLVPGSLSIRNVQDTLVDTTVSRTYSPPPKDTSSRDSGGGSSGGRSSYSSSYKGSSGSSHSGSGRKF